MPIQFPDFPMLTRGQVSTIPGAQAGMGLQEKLLANALNQYKLQQEANRSQYYPRLNLAETLKSEAEPNEINQRAGLYGAQTNEIQQLLPGRVTKLGLENKYYGPNIESEMALRKQQGNLAGAQATGALTENQINQLKLDQMKKYLSQTSAGGVNSGNASTPANSVYGIETPVPSNEDVTNKMLFGIDTFGPRKENAAKQQQDQYESFQKGLASSVQAAQAANNMNQAISVFNNAMDKSFYRGSRLGHLSSSGMFSPPGDLSPEQEADRAALQMLPAAIETLRDAMGQARFSNLDMGMASKMKFDRTMTDDARALQSQWINGVNERMIENSKFMKTLGTPSSGATKTDADMLWNAYQQDFPLVSQDGKTFQGSNLGNWPLYTTPGAIESIRKTGTYSPTKSERNVFMMQVPDGKGGSEIVPIKSGKVESAFRKGARPL